MAAAHVNSSDHEAGLRGMRSSTISTSCLASLQPYRIAPPPFSARTQIVLALRRAECIHVVPSSQQHGGFTLQVFFKPLEHHLVFKSDPSHHQPSSAHIGDRAPDVLVDKSMTEIVKLRDDLFYLTRLGHGLKPCAFCLGVIDYCGYGRVKPHWSMAWFHTVETVSEKLSMYMNDVLEIVLKVKTFAHAPCVGQERIPLRLYLFLNLQRTVARA